MQRRKRSRSPVLSRLTWAWLAASAASISLVSAFFVASRSGEGAERIALPISRVEIFANNHNSHHASEPGSEERIAAPSLRDVQGAAGGPALAAADAKLSKQGFVEQDGEDGLVLIYPGENDLFAENEDGYLGDDESPYSADDVVITIAGGTKRATRVTAASLTPVIQAIPDPDAALLRSSALGKTPRIAPDGRKAVSYYNRPFQGGRSKPRVAIIVGGLGLNAAVTERAIDDLPADVSLSFAPYAKNLDFWTRKARQAGHEVLIELPMEGYGANTEALGAAALLSSRSAEENLQRLDWLMARFGAYFAATNYLGAKFSADEAAIAPILQKLKDSGVGYIDDTGAASRVASGLPIATVSRMIPAAADASDLRAVVRELAALEKIAERDGFALGKTYAYAATIDEIVAWSRTLEEKGIVTAPASALLQAAGANR